MKKIIYFLVMSVLFCGLVKLETHAKMEMGKEKIVLPQKMESADPKEAANKSAEILLRKANKEEIGKKALCAVLNSNFDIKANTDVIDYKGKSYYFCCESCVNTFKENPEEYVIKEEVVKEEVNDRFSGEKIDGFRKIKIEAFKFGFKPNMIVVKKGEKIQLIAKSTDVKHGLAIKEFNVNQELPPNAEKIIEFIADKAGRFVVYCSVYCGSGHRKMLATLVVEK